MPLANGHGVKAEKVSWYRKYKAKNTPSTQQLYSCVKIIVSEMIQLPIRLFKVQPDQLKVYCLTKKDGIADKILKAQPCWNLPECDSVWQVFHAGNKPHWYLETGHHLLPSKQKSSLAEEEIWSLWAAQLHRKPTSLVSFRVFCRELLLGE